MNFVMLFFLDLLNSCYCYHEILIIPSLEVTKRTVLSELPQKLNTSATVTYFTKEPDKNANTDPDFSRYLNLCRSNPLVPYKTEPTRNMGPRDHNYFYYIV